MIRVIYAALFVTILPVSLRADSWGPPTPSVHVSKNAGLIARIEPGSANPDGSGAKAAHCRFYRYSEEKKMYEFWRGHDLVNDARPCGVAIPDDGSFLVTFDDYMGVGTSENTVVVYDAAGRMLKKWALEDILSAAEIEELPHSTMSIHWRGDVGVMMSRQHEVYISPPESSFKSDKDQNFKGFMLDVKALTIRENSQRKRSSENQKAGAVDSDQRTFRIWRMIAFIEAVALVAIGAGWALIWTRRTGSR